MTVTEKTARSVTEFMDDPIGFFGQSYVIPLWKLASA